MFKYLDNVSSKISSSNFVGGYAAFLNFHVLKFFNSNFSEFSAIGRSSFLYINIFNNIFFENCKINKLSKSSYGGLTYLWFKNTIGLNKTIIIICLYLFIFVYICLYLFIFVYICLYLFIFVYICLYLFIFVYICLYLFIFVYICLYLFIFVYICLYLFIFVYICLYLFIFVYICLYLFIFVYICLYLFIFVYICL